MDGFVQVLLNMVLLQVSATPVSLRPDLPIQLLDMELRASPAQVWEALWAKDAAGLMRLHAQLGDHSLSVVPWQWKGTMNDSDGHASRGSNLFS